MERKYCRCDLQINNRILHTIWYDNDYSGFHLTESGSIAAFDSIAELDKYAAEMNVQLKKSSRTYNFDAIAKWLKDPKGKTVLCSEFLDLYNLAGDFRNSLAERNLDVEDKSYPNLLVKLFWGCNLTAVTPPCKKFKPVWSKAEVRELRRAMRESLLVFNSNLDVT